MSEVRLVKYDAARNALAEAHRVDEVKDVRDKAVAMKAYAMQAKDGALLAMAAEIKARAERRAGELLREMEKNKGGNPNLFPQGNRLPKLPDLGITPKQSSAWQRVAAIPEARFEEIVAGAAAAGSRLTTKALVTEGKKSKSQGTKKKTFKGPRVEDVVDPSFLVLSDLSKLTKERPAASIVAVMKKQYDAGGGLDEGLRDDLIRVRAWFDELIIGIEPFIVSCA